MVGLLLAGCCLVCWLAGWLVGWLVCWFVGWLVGWLADWLANWLGSWMASLLALFAQIALLRFDGLLGSLVGLLDLNLPRRCV